jgi:cytochrome b
MGGRRAAEAIADTRERAIRGAIAGTVFASLVAVGSAMATIVVWGPTGWHGRFGPALLSTVVLALLWGVAGGVVGAVLPASRQAIGATGPPPD